MKKPIKPLAELLDSVRDIEGFPIGTDEDILALSDPPYYTACPNPYINDFIEEYGTPYDEKTDDYHREPFVGDVSEGKNDKYYLAHTYHTKVPPSAITQYIKHYSEKGDIVLDCFSGSGMTGVASLNSSRNVILSDLSPAATFISYNFNSNIDHEVFISEANTILSEVQKECEWMNQSLHNGEHDCSVNYIVWSDVLISPFTHEEFIYYDVAYDKLNGLLLDEFPCPYSGATLKKKDCKKATIEFFDKALGRTITQHKQTPILINYTYNNKKYTKRANDFDIELIARISVKDIPYWYPINKLPKGDKTGEPIRLGLTHIHHLYTKRNLWILAAILEKISKLRDRRFLLTLLTSVVNRNLFKGNRFIINKYNPNGRINGPLSGTLYIPSLTVEQNPIKLLQYKIKQLSNMYKKNPTSSRSIISTSSSTEGTLIQPNSIDYIFTDPPFGANIMYSELNFIWESWLKILTDNSKEAIINKTQNKGLHDYHSLMLKSFKSYYNYLKPNRWITVVFHNSKSAVWNSIQEGLTKAGFVVASVSILDKKKGTINQSYIQGTVKNDLVISAYKPKQSFDKKFLELAGEGLEEEFIKMHLSHLKAEPTVERTEQMLYSKLLAYYVQRSYTVKYDSSTFYKMLRDNFTEEDSYWFIEDQLDNYHEYKQKMKLQNIDEIKSGQMVLFIWDEKSAIIWLNSFLNEPKDFQEIHPAYTKIANIAGDNVPDIKELLDKNFILEKGKYRRPQSEDEKLSVVEKRERELQREFDTLLLEAKGSKKKIKECRKQAVIYGFEQCYKHNEFKDILTLASRLDKKIIENDSEITEFIEVAEMKEEGF